LYLFVVGYIIFAADRVHAQDLSFACVLPSFFATHHIVDFFSFKLQFVFKSLFNTEYVWTRLAEEAEIGESLLD
jgi:long-subunit fatty acid transport protein